MNQAFVIQKNFSHNAAHEFRTPLAILKTRIGLFRKKQDFRPQAIQDFLRIIEGEVDYLSAMVGSLLELASMERMDRSERISMEKLVQSAVDEAELLAAERNVSVLAEVSPCILRGNERLLRRAVANLLENAIKYSPAGGAVRISGHPMGSLFRLEVIDQGPGIPEELHGRIFEPFFRVDSARSRQQGERGLDWRWCGRLQRHMVVRFI